VDVKAESLAPRTTRNERQVIAAIVVLMAIFSFWLASNSTFDPGYEQPNEPFNTDFYRQQAIAMLDGRLDVPFEQYEFNECFFREGRCYGYFGVVPSVLRFGAFLATGSTDSNPSPLIVAAAVSVALWAAIALALGVADSLPRDERLDQRSRIHVIVMTGVLLGPGGLLTFLSQAKIYYEAIVLMIAAMLVCFVAVQRWVNWRKQRHLIIALISGVLAANSRPAALLPMALLGIGVAVIALREQRPDRSRTIMLGAALAVLPAASAMGTMWLKLRTFTPSFELYRGYSEPGIQDLLRANDGRLQGLRFLPTNLANFLRPDSLGWSSEWPLFRHLLPLEKGPIVVAPMNRAGMYVEYAASLTNTMPVPLLFTIGVTILVLMGAIRLTQAQLRTFGLLMVAAGSCCLAVLTSFGVTTRYLGDFVPLVVVGTAFALVLVVRRLQDMQWVRGIVLVLVCASAMLTLAINLSLQQQSFTIAG